MQTTTTVATAASADAAADAAAASEGSTMVDVQVATILRALAPEEIDMLRDAFIYMDRDSDGYLAEDELLTCTDAYVDATRVPPLCDYLRPLFAVADKDGDGRLSLAEFLLSFVDGPGVVPAEVINGCVAAVRVRLSDEEIAALQDNFRCIDRDADGYLDRAELTQALRATLLSRFPDLTSDNFHEIVSVILAHADRDGDGRLSLAEFIRSYQEDQGVLPAAFVDTRWGSLAEDHGKDMTMAVGVAAADAPPPAQAQPRHTGTVKGDYRSNGGKSGNGGGCPCALSATGPLVRVPTRDEAAALHDAFAALDTNRDGYVDARDVYAALWHVLARSPDDEPQLHELAGLVMTCADRHARGRITVGEFVSSFVRHVEVMLLPVAAAQERMREACEELLRYCQARIDALDAHHSDTTEAAADAGVAADDDDHVEAAHDALMSSQLLQTGEMATVLSRVFRDAFPAWRDDTRAAVMTALVVGTAALDTASRDAHIATTGDDDADEKEKDDADDADRRPPCRHGLRQRSGSHDDANDDKNKDEANNNDDNDSKNDNNSSSSSSTSSSSISSDATVTLTEDDVARIHVALAALRDRGVDDDGCVAVAALRDALVDAFDGDVATAERMLRHVLDCVTRQNDDNDNNNSNNDDDSNDDTAQSGDGYDAAAVDMTDNGQLQPQQQPQQAHSDNDGGDDDDSRAVAVTAPARSSPPLCAVHNDDADADDEDEEEAVPVVAAGKLDAMMTATESDGSNGTPPGATLTTETNASIDAAAAHNANATVELYDSDKDDDERAKKNNNAADDDDDVAAVVLPPPPGPRAVTATPATVPTRNTDADTDADEDDKTHTHAAFSHDGSGSSSKDGTPRRRAPPSLPTSPSSSSLSPRRVDDADTTTQTCCRLGKRATVHASAVELDVIVSYHDRCPPTAAAATTMASSTPPVVPLPRIAPPAVAAATTTATTTAAADGDGDAQQTKRATSLPSASLPATTGTNSSADDDDKHGNGRTAPTATAAAATTSSTRRSLPSSSSTSLSVSSARASPEQATRLPPVQTSPPSSSLVAVPSPPPSSQLLPQQQQQQQQQRQGYKSVSSSSFSSRSSPLQASLQQQQQQQQQHSATPPSPRRVSAPSQDEWSPQQQQPSQPPPPLRPRPPAAPAAPAAARPALAPTPPSSFSAQRHVLPPLLSRCHSYDAHVSSAVPCHGVVTTTVTTTASPSSSSAAPPRRVPYTTRTSLPSTSRQILPRMFATVSPSRTTATTQPALHIHHSVSLLQARTGVVCSHTCTHFERIHVFDVDRNASYAPSEAELRALFRRYDTHNRGYLDRDAFKQVYMSLEQYGVPPSPRLVERRFQQYARNSERIYFNEFCILMLQRVRM